MRYKGPLQEGYFVRRVNRFLVEVALGNAITEAHLPNSGRLTELLVPGAPVRLVPHHRGHRKTAYTLEQVGLARPAGACTWVCVNAGRPNELVCEAVVGGRITPLAGCQITAREITVGGSRLDLALRRRRTRYLVEVKSVTLADAGTAMFPDAPTARGRKHLETLMQETGRGRRGVVVFCAQRPDVRRFRPHHAHDPEFGRLLREAKERGVLILAYRCRVTPGEIALESRVPVRV